MRVNRLTGFKKLSGFGPKIADTVDAKPDGLLSHENFLFSLFRPPVGMRQYWQDFASFLVVGSIRSSLYLVTTVYARFKKHGLQARSLLLLGEIEAVYDNIAEAMGFFVLRR